MTALLKQRGAKARRGHLRIAVGDLFWYVDLRAEAPGPQAPLRLELGCWAAAVAPEPDGGAIDCPLLLDVLLGADPVAEVGAWLDVAGEIGDLSTLGARLGEFPGALVDKALRDHL
ncbi:hypothetical protein E8D34_17515 [Nocardioides sp. GY 10113]|uniref:hypothetical protein n=1 Tax=Nocardioides sp. GY 10113 TaxID=2569761 RepID=UPI0010A93B2B|nr:hypothetical protein [Nocardioides sp. GY 10113]TIC81485.1 hypothetical protein E8D34_17515 [Nocardioides sp. GY 10113]